MGTGLVQALHSERVHVRVQLQVEPRGHSWRKTCSKARPLASTQPRAMIHKSTAEQNLQLTSACLGVRLPVKACSVNGMQHTMLHIVTTRSATELKIQ